MNKTFLTVFALIGIFLCGAIVGGVVSDRYVRPLTIQKRAAEQQLTSQPWMRITNRLNPTAEQREKIRAIITAHMQEQQNARKATQAAIDKTQADIIAVLTPAQQADYDAIRAKNREIDRIWQRWYREIRAKHETPPLILSAPPPPPRPADAPKGAPKRLPGKQDPGAKQGPVGKQGQGGKQGPGKKQPAPQDTP